MDFSAFPFSDPLDQNWAGAARLGWVAGEMSDSDPWLIKQFGQALTHQLEYPAAILSAFLVLGLGYVFKPRRPEPAL